MKACFKTIILTAVFGIPAALFSADNLILNPSFEEMDPAGRLPLHLMPNDTWLLGFAIPPDSMSLPSSPFTPIQLDGLHAVHARRVNLLWADGHATGESTGDIYRNRDVWYIW